MLTSKDVIIDQEFSLPKILPWAAKGGLAILDQGSYASTNFIINILLARWLSRSEYGAFALAYSVFLLLGAFHSAIFTEPMLVFGSGKYLGHFRKYLGALVRRHCALMLPGTLLLLVVGVVLGRVYSPLVERAFLGLAMAGPCILLLWLVRRAFYVELRPGWAAAGGGIYLLVLLPIVAALRFMGRLTPSTGFLAMGAGALVVSAALLLRLHPRLRRDSEIPTPAMVTEDHWRYGRWSLATAGIQWFSGNIYYVVLPAWIGLQGAGALRALMNFPMPVFQTMAALSGLLLPILSRDLHAGGRERMNTTVSIFLGLFLLGAGLYLGLIWGFRREVFQLFYAGKYQEYGSWPLLLALLIPFAGAVTGVFGAAARALERPDWGFWCGFVSGIVALAAGLPLCMRWGVSGAIGAQLLSTLMGGLLLLRLYKQPLPESAD